MFGTPQEVVDEERFWSKQIEKQHMKKHVICYSGGHSSALVAIEVVRRYGKENVILLNHDINSKFEDTDIKRFKKEVADYLELPVTYKNYMDLPLSQLPDQFEVVEIENSFVSPQTRQALCTSRLKTTPLTEYLKQYFPDKDCILYYGFDENELVRVDRRKSILNDMGYESDYPLALWGEGKFKALKDFYTKLKINFESICKSEKIEDRDLFERTIFSTNEIDIIPPNTYNVFKHANCIGCLKAGQQHWYIVYFHYNWVFERAKLSEERIGYSIIKGSFLKDLEPKFEKMKRAGVDATEHIASQTFWSKAKKFIKKLEEDEKPCECSF
jgi:hypothetical protein